MVDQSHGDLVLLFIPLLSLLYNICVMKTKDGHHHEEYKVYKLIYDRAISSLMADSKYLSTTIILDNNDYK